MPYRGGCRCGAVRYEVEQVFDAGWCHCRSCQRHHGAAALPWFCFATGDLTIQGPLAVFRGEGATGDNRFCSTCGTQMGWFPDDPSRHASMPIPTLDDPEAVAPAIHQWASSQLSWHRLDDDLPRVADGQLPHPDER